MYIYIYIYIYIYKVKFVPQLILQILLFHIKKINFIPSFLLKKLDFPESYNLIGQEHFDSQLMNKNCKYFNLALFPIKTNNKNF